MKDAVEHDTGEGEVVESFESSGEPFVVSRESAEACGPGEAAFDDPSVRQQDKAPFRPRVF